MTDFRELTDAQAKLLATVEVGDDLILSTMTGLYELFTTFDLTVAEDAYFKRSGLDEKYYLLKKCFNNFKKITIDGEIVTEYDKFINGFADETLALIFENMGYSPAFAIRKPDFKFSDILKSSLVDTVKYLNESHPKNNELYYKNFLKIFNLKDFVNNEQLKNFFKQTFGYAERQILKNDIKCLKQAVEISDKTDSKTKSFVVNNNEFVEEICKFMPNSKVLEVYDSLTDKGYYVIDLLTEFNTPISKDVLNKAIAGDEQYICVGGIDDKINLITGKTVLTSNKISYCFDFYKACPTTKKICSMVSELMVDKERLYQLRPILTDFAQLYTIFSVNDDLRTYVNEGLIKKLNQFGFEKRVKKHLKNNEKLAKFLQKCENSIKVDIDNYGKKMLQAKDFCDKVEQGKVVVEEPFQEFL